MIVSVAVLVAITALLVVLFFTRKRTRVSLVAPRDKRGVWRTATAFLRFLYRTVRRTQRPVASAASPAADAATDGSESDAEADVETATWVRRVAATPLVREAVSDALVRGLVKRVEGALAEFERQGYIAASSCRCPQLALRPELQSVRCASRIRPVSGATDALRETVIFAVVSGSVGGDVAVATEVVVSRSRHVPVSVVVRDVFVEQLSLKLVLRDVPDAEDPTKPPRLSVTASLMDHPRGQFDVSTQFGPPKAPWRLSDWFFVPWLAEWWLNRKAAELLQPESRTVTLDLHGAAVRAYEAAATAADDDAESCSTRS